VVWSYSGSGSDELQFILKTKPQIANTVEVINLKKKKKRPVQGGY